MVWYTSTIQPLLLTVILLTSSEAIDYEFTSAITYQVFYQVYATWNFYDSSCNAACFIFKKPSYTGSQKNAGRSRRTQHMQNVTIQSLKERGQFYVAKTP